MEVQEVYGNDGIIEEVNQSSRGSGGEMARVTITLMNELDKLTKYWNKKVEIMYL